MKKLGTYAIFSFMLSITLIFSQAAFAGDKELTFVYGTVYDVDTDFGLAGVTVTARCVETGNEKTDPNTDSSGYYQIPTLECSVGNEIIVIVTVDDVEYTNSNTVADCNDELNMCNSKQHVGISKIDVSVPEFPVAMRPILLSVLSFGLIRERLI